MNRTKNDLKDMWDLERAFAIAKALKHEYFAVIVKSAFMPLCEVIINPMYNAEKKLEYYKNSYHQENLKLKADNRISIVGFASGDSYSELECELFL